MPSTVFRVYKDGYELLDAQKLGVAHKDSDTLEHARLFAASLLARGTPFLIVPVVDGRERRSDALREIAGF